MKGLAVNALSAVASGLMQVGAGVASFVKDSIGAAGSFEAGMNTFSAAAGVGADELDAFKQQFIDLGKELPVSTKEVQDAATAMVKGGIEPAVVAGGALKDTLLFAAAAGMELEAAANLTAKQLGTFISATATAEEKTAFMAKSQELLVKAANASTLNVDKLGEAMLAAGGQARAMGLDYQDFVTTMGLISPAFSSAAEAGTSFKNFLVRLIPATDKAKEMMRDLNLLTEDGTSKFFDASGAYIGGAKAAQLLQDALKDLSPMQRTTALQTIFGNDAMGAAAALLDAGANGYDKFADSMANANGIAGQTATTQQGLNFAMQNFGGSVEALQITLGTAFLPILTSLMSQFTTGLNGVIKFTETFMKLAPAIGESTTPIQTFFNVLGIALSSVIPGAGAGLIAFGGAVQSLIDPVLKVWNAFTVLFGVITNGPTTMASLVGAITTLASTFGISAETVASVVSVLSQMYDIGAQLVSQIPGIVAAAVTMGQQFLSVLLPALSAVGGFLLGTLLPALLDLVQWLADQIPVAVAFVSSIFTNVLMPVFTIVSGFIVGTLVPAITTLFEWVQTNLPTAITFLSTTWNTVLLPAITAIATFFTGTLVPAFNTVWAFISDTLLPILEDLATLGFNKLKADATAFSTFFTTTLLPAITSVANFIKDNLMTAITAMNPAITASKANLEGFASGFKVVGEAISGAISKLKDFLDWAAKASGARIPSGGTSGGSAIPARALGGPVTGGMPYLIGERGPELFVPKQSGTIIPNDKIGSAGVTNNYNYSPVYSSTPAQPSSDFALMRSLATAGT